MRLVHFCSSKGLATASAFPRMDYRRLFWTYYKIMSLTGCCLLGIYESTQLYPKPQALCFQTVFDHV